MKALVFEQFGDPASVLQLRDVPKPEPGPGTVRVRMIASPINPSDLLVVRGRYGRLPTLPATPGFEGVGVVDAAGPGLLGRLRNGKRVAVLNGAGGNWQQFVIVPSRQVVPLPAKMPDEQGATFFVNPATALIMTRSVLGVSSGDWLLQSAAAGTLGKMVIRLAGRFGFRTINIVRRPEQADELKWLGADAIINSATESIPDRVREITGAQGVPYAIDAVGGATASAMISALGPSGRLLCYGTLSNEPASIDPRVLMVQGARVEGFWLSNWTRQQGALRMLKLFRDVGRLIAAGDLASTIAGSYPFDKFQDAIKEAQTPGRSGKILLRLDQ